MARRLGPKPPTVVNPPAPTQYVAARTKGLQLIGTLQPAGLSRIVKIDNAEGFLQMDQKLAVIRNVRAQWKLALEPISGPLDRAIKAAQEAVKEAKNAAQGVSTLDKEITEQLDKLEKHVKGLMADYKVEEQRRLQAAEQDRQREAHRLQEEARKKQLQASTAKTPGLRARLEQQRATLEAEAQQVVEATPEELSPVKGAASVTRKQRKVRVVNPLAFMKAVTDYEPTAGVYAFGKPPLMTVDKNGEAAPLVEVVTARLNDLYREQPGVVASWPGVEVYDDITIAGR